MDRRSNPPAVGTPQPSMADVKARLDFSPSLQSPSPGPRRAPPSAHLALSHRPGDYHMTKQNPAILDQLLAPRQTSVKDPLVYKSPTYVPPPPPAHFVRPPSTHSTSLLLHTINSRRNSQPTGASLVQMAVRGSQRGGGEHALASPVIVRLSGTGSALRPRGGEDVQHPVANPCDKDVVLSALKQKRKRKAASPSVSDSTAFDENSISTGPRAKKSRCNGLPSNDLPNGVTAMDTDGRKRSQESLPAPLSKRNKSEDPVTSLPSTVPLKVPDLECEVGTKRSDVCSEDVTSDGGRKKRFIGTRNASSTPPVPEEERERESPQLKKKREDSQQLHRTLTTIFPSTNSSSSGMRRKLPVFCATGSKPPLVTQLTRTHWATDEDLRSDREAMTEKVMQFLSEEGEEDKKTTASHISSATTSISVPESGASVSAKAGPSAPGFPSVASNIGTGLQLSSVAPDLTATKASVEPSVLSSASKISVSPGSQSAVTLPAAGVTGTSPRQPAQTGSIPPLLGQIGSVSLSLPAPSQQPTPSITTTTTPILGTQIGPRPAMSTAEAGKAQQESPLGAGALSSLPTGSQSAFSLLSSSVPTISMVSGGVQSLGAGLKLQSSTPLQVPLSTGAAVTSSVATTQPSLMLSSLATATGSSGSDLSNPPMVGTGGFPPLLGLFQGNSQLEVPTSQGSDGKSQGNSRLVPASTAQSSSSNTASSSSSSKGFSFTPATNQPVAATSMATTGLLTGMTLGETGQTGVTKQPGLIFSQLQGGQSTTTNLAGVFGQPQSGAAMVSGQTPLLGQPQGGQAASIQPALFGKPAQVPTANQPNLFAQPTQTLAANQPNLFGQPAQAPTANQPNLFGQPAQAPTANQPNLFGQPAQAPIANQPNLFGQPAQAPTANQPNLFGQPAQAPAANQPNLFGQSAQAPAANQPILFGQPAKAPTANQPNLFGQPAKAPPANQPNLFGQPAKAPPANQPNLFGQPAQVPAANQPNLFGQPVQVPAANQPNVLGQPAQMPTVNQPSLFGQPVQAPAANQFSLFGQPTQAPAANKPGLFGQPAQAPAANQSTSLYGQAQGKPTQQPLFGQTQPTTANQPFTFGSSSATGGQPALNSGQPFVFGKPPQATASPAPQVQPALFGAAASTNQSAFMFGKQSGQSATAQTSQPSSLFALSQMPQNTVANQPFGATGGSLQGPGQAMGAGMFGQSAPKATFQFGATVANQTGGTGGNSEGFKFGAPNQGGVNQGSAGFNFGGTQSGTQFNFSSVQGTAPSLASQQQSGLNFQVGGANFGAPSTGGNRTVAKAKRKGGRR